MPNLAHRGCGMMMHLMVHCALFLIHDILSMSMKSHCTELQAFLAQVSAMGYFMFGFQHDASKFGIFYVVILLVQLISESTGMLFAMLVATADLAVVLLSIEFILLLTLTGFLTTDTPPYYEWIMHIDYLRCACHCVRQRT